MPGRERLNGCVDPKANALKWWPHQARGLDLHRPPSVSSSILLSCILALRSRDELQSGKKTAVVFAVRKIRCAHIHRMVGCFPPSIPRPASSPSIILLP